MRHLDDSDLGTKTFIGELNLFVSKICFKLSSCTDPYNQGIKLFENDL